MSGKKRTLDSWLSIPKKVKTTSCDSSNNNLIPSDSQSSSPKADIIPAPTHCYLEAEHPFSTNSDVAHFRPPTEHKFPRTNDRSCLHSWFITFKWLHYDVNKDHVLCFTCVHATKLQKLTDFKGIETSFFISGFKNWKKAIERFKSHEKSSFHAKSTHYMIQREKGTPVINLISAKSATEQKRACCALKTIISSIRYLARSGQALRGGEAESGNLYKLLEERCGDVTGLKSWLEKRDKFLSGEIQNEILEIMAHAVQRNLVEELNSSQYFGLIADGTTDIGGNEQFSVCLRHVRSDTLSVIETFFGMYSLPDSKSDTLFIAIKDMFLRLGLDASKLRGHCFDGAANMSGKIKGVQKQLMSFQPKSMFVHCANHSLDLALQELGRKSEMICDALGIVKNVSNIILESSKRREIYKNIVLCPSTSQENGLILDCEGKKISNLLTLCPTRWTVRCKSIRRFVDNYERVEETLEKILQEPGLIRDDRKSTLKGYILLMHKFETVFGIKAALSIFTPCEELANALQKPGFTAAGAKKAAEILINTLDKKRNEHEFNKLWESTEKSDYDLKPPTEPRTKRPPKKLEQTDHPAAPVELNARGNMRKSYFQIIDCITSELRRRFCQESMNTMIQLESVLESRAILLSLDELKEKLNKYSEEFDLERLHAQLTMLPTIVTNGEMSLTNIVNQLQTQPKVVRNLFDQVIRLITLLLTVPASAASAERSFSALRRVKTYLRSVMSQKRLTHLLLLHIHEEKTKNLNLEDMMNEFISRTTERKTVFGFA